MNTFYVTVSISLLLVFAGFNHAHGLTTFGKTATSTSAPHRQTPIIPCQTQMQCIKDTTCMHGRCVCGDNSNPKNGQCTAQFKGPRHVCADTNQCDEGAECKLNVTINPDYKICQCLEGFFETENTCSDGYRLEMIPEILFVVLATIFRILE